MKQLVVQATIEVSGLIKILQNRKTLKKKNNSSCSHMQALEEFDSDLIK